MNSFNEWWNSIYSDEPKHIYRQCYEEGYNRALKDSEYIVTIAKYVIFSIVFCISILSLI